jgi:proline iminopeptidase
MPRFESRLIAGSSTKLAIRLYPGEGEPIVLLHGGPGMGNYFDDALPDMLRPHGVVSYDQRGCGQSICAGSFGVDDHVGDLDAVRKHLGTNRVHLFGHSWGGLLGQLYAKAHPNHVASLVLCCSMANTGRDVGAMESKGIGERVIGRAKRSVAWAAAGTLMQCPGRLGDLGFGLVMKQLLPNYVVRRESAPRHYDVTRASKRAWRATNQSIKAIGEHALTGMAIDAPVLIVQGEQDVIRETNAVLASRFPAAANVRIANASHFPWLEQPDAFARAVRDFYGEASGTSSITRS